MCKVSQGCPVTLAEPVVININILELGVKLSVTFSGELYRLYIIAVDHLLFISVKSNFFKELLPLN